MMLGDYLAAARTAGADVQGWLDQTGPQCADALARLAAAEGISPTRAARLAVADFSRAAGDEDWATLISHVRDAADPGLACLAAMIDWRVAQTPCKAHAHAPDVTTPARLRSVS